MAQAASVRPDASEASPLAVICGGGTLPFAVADALIGSGRSVYLLAIEGFADRAAVARYPHDWIAVGRFGRMLRLLREAGCRDVTCIGTMVRPALRDMRLDWTTLRMLPQLYRLFRGGDDHLLSGVARLFEQQGLRLLGPHEVAPEILVQDGVLTSTQPTARDLADAAHGFALLDAIGPFDVGQAAVVADKHVLAVEAVEGTDAMLLRVAELREHGRIAPSDRTGVLVKAPKPAQELRLDLPAIGPQTVDGVRRAGLRGIMLRAGAVMIAEPFAVKEAADRAGIFVVGVNPEAAPGP